MKLTPECAGCWVDNTRGIYIGEAVIAEARNFGWSGGNEIYTVDSDEYHEATDEAIDYLISICPNGYWIGFTESLDFGMWSCDED